MKVYRCLSILNISEAIIEAYPNNAGIFMRRDKACNLSTNSFELFSRKRKNIHFSGRDYAQILTSTKRIN